MNRKFLKSAALLMAMVICAAVFTSCKNGETYAKMKERERNAIEGFISWNHFTGRINVITEDTFNAQGQTTNTDKNEFVRFEKDGIYMQIVRKGVGYTMYELSAPDAQYNPDSTTTQTICCRFLEYDIENADTTCTNMYQTQNAYVDKMQCTYTRLGKSYTAWFTAGKMKEYHSSSSVVPTGWLKPLDYIRLAKSEGSGEVAKVRLIVPHSSGTANAGVYVLPFYYEITYQLGK
ncbi:MAG: DUF4827 domain-containing protein [Bacteroidaceae bacterium]|nr:DUF4827 domain-containing protein [Bacteroidaceae bacterium]MBP5523550.1 DUF4827 domain-containing protein [Bacteroidaceae bacterium]